MMNLNRVRSNVERMLRRFESERVTVFRPVVDAYGQPTDDRTAIGSAECWRNAMNRPDKWQISESGARYDDQGAIWITLLQSKDLPKVRHEDICVLEDGTEYSIKNILGTGPIRVFWQLADPKQP